VTVFGAGLHIVTSDAKRAKVAIKKCLEELNIKEVSVETIFPNMEDVFISLIEEVDRNKREPGAREAKSV
jgi:ABC-2 type transport system ATP-binding protein